MLNDGKTYTILRHLYYKPLIRYVYFLIFFFIANFIVIIVLKIILILSNNAQKSRIYSIYIVII